MAKKYEGEFPQIGVPAFRALDSAGITHLSDLTKYTEKQMLELHGFGPKALGMLKARLSEKKLSFAK